MDYDYDVDDDYGGRILWGRVAFFGIGLLLFFLLGRCTASGVPESELNEARQQVAELSQQVTTLEGQLAAQQVGQPTPDTTATPGATDEPGATGTETPTDGDAPTGGSTYTVQEGDTLYTIAQEVYGDGSLYTLIVEANNLSEDNPLRQGQVLQIPEREGNST